MLQREKKQILGDNQAYAAADANCKQLRALEAQPSLEMKPSLGSFCRSLLPDVEKQAPTDFGELSEDERLHQEVFANETGFMQSTIYNPMRAKEQAKEEEVSRLATEWGTTVEKAKTIVDRTGGEKELSFEVPSRDLGLSKCGNRGMGLTRNHGDNRSTNQMRDFDNHSCLILKNRVAVLFVSSYQRVDVGWSCHGRAGTSIKAAGMYHS